MATEGKIFIKILKDVCTNMPYFGHSHERSVVHLLNPCSNVPRKKFQCVPFDFEYYEEGDDLVFKFKETTIYEGYNNMTKDIHVAYIDNNGEHNIGGCLKCGNFNKSQNSSDPFFKKEGDYYVGKVNKDCFFLNCDEFEKTNLIVKIVYYDEEDDTPEGEKQCISSVKRATDYVPKQKPQQPPTPPKKKMFKCSMNISANELLDTTKRVVGYDLTLVMSNGVYVNNGDTVKYWLDIYYDDVKLKRELVKTHTTTTDNEDLPIAQYRHLLGSEKPQNVRFDFLLELPEGFYPSEPATDLHGCISTTYDLEPDKPGKPGKPKKNADCYITNSRIEGNKIVFDFSKTLPDNSYSYEPKLLYSEDDNRWNEKSFVNYVENGNSLEINIPEPYVRYYRVRVDIMKDGERKTSCFTDKLEKQQQSVDDIDCSNANLTDLNGRLTYDAGLYAYVNLLNDEDYEVKPKLYYSKNGIDWTIDENSDNAFIGGSYSNFSYDINTVRYDDRKYYKAEVEIKNKKTSTIINKTCSAICKVEGNIQTETLCQSINILEETNTDGNSNYKGSIYIDFQSLGNNINTFKIKVFYRFFDEIDLKELKEITFNVGDYVQGRPFDVYIPSPREKYYLKAELWSFDGTVYGIEMCHSDETLIRKD